MIVYLADTFGSDPIYGVEGKGFFVLYPHRSELECDHLLQLHSLRYSLYLERL